MCNALYNHNLIISVNIGYLKYDSEYTFFENVKQSSLQKSVYFIYFSFLFLCNIILEYFP